MKKCKEITCYGNPDNWPGHVGHDETDHCHHCRRSPNLKDNYYLMPTRGNNGNSDSKIIANEKSADSEASH